MTEGTDLKKVDSAVQGVDPESDSPKNEKRSRKISVDCGTVDMKSLSPDEVKFAHDAIQAMAWKISSSTTSVLDKEVCKKMLTEPPVRSFEFCVPLSETTPGVEFKVLKPRGVTIKDVMDKLSKKYKGHPDEDLPEGPSRTYLKGFKWNPNFEKWVMVLDDEASMTGGGAASKKNKKKKEEAE